jgi:hypothetical protein
MEGRWFYPGSGATSDSQPRAGSQPQPQVAAAADGGGSAGILPEQPAGNNLKNSCPEEFLEDPEGEFSRGADSQQARSSGPRVINVGIPGPGERGRTCPQASALCLCLCLWQLPVSRCDARGLFRDKGVAVATSMA